MPLVHTTQKYYHQTLKVKINYAASHMRRVSETCLVICFQQATQPLVSKRASHVSLPHIGSPATGLKSTMSMEKYPVIIHEPTAIRTARRVSVLPPGGGLQCKKDRGAGSTF